MGGGVFEIGNPEGEGGGVAQAVLEIQVEGKGRGSKNMPSIRGVCGFFLE